MKERIAHELKNLDFMNDPEATDKQEELTAMSISCDAAIIFAERPAEPVSYTPLAHTALKHSCP